MSTKQTSPHIKKLLLHKDNRGWFAEVLRPGNITKSTFGQLSITAIAPNKSKGNHYHRHQHEWFVAVSGTVTLELIQTTTMKRVVYVLDSKQPSIVYIPPLWQHTLINTSKKICTVLLYTDVPNNMKHLDVYTKKI